MTAVVVVVLVSSSPSAAAAASSTEEMSFELIKQSIEERMTWGVACLSRPVAKFPIKSPPSPHFSLLCLSLPNEGFVQV